jgi:hypothetical protein
MPIFASYTEGPRVLFLELFRPVSCLATAAKGDDLGERDPRKVDTKQTRASEVYTQPDRQPQVGDLGNGQEQHQDAGDRLRDNEPPESLHVS